MHGIAKLKKVALLTAGLSFVFALISCTEKRASENEIAEYVKEHIPESVTLVEKSTSEKNKIDVVYHYKCNNRDLSFDVWSNSGTINIDGSFFGYTGDYNIVTDYADKCYAYYNDTMLNLLKKHGFLKENESFENLNHSNTFDYCKDFRFVFDNSTYDFDSKYVDAFLNDVRTEIMQKEYETTGQELQFSYEIYLKIDENYYQRTAGPENYEVDMDKDMEVHIHDDVKPHSMMQSNVISPVYNGVLIDLSERKDG